MTGRGRKREKPGRKDKRKKRNKKLASERRFTDTRQVQKHLPKSGAVSEKRLKARNLGNADGYLQMQMRFDLLKHADRDGRWRWGRKRNWCEEYGPCEGCHDARAKKKSVCKILALLRDMEKRTWLEILDPGIESNMRIGDHHYQPIHTLCREAQERWHDLGLDQEENNLFRFRGSPKERLWGFRLLNIFYAVWWDPDHKIYPTEKRS
ncbi:MAG: hypothetical protein ISN29_02370 [Gammaproteobacteria bacterium AqS3]|nr:hypothetical protein [Gammaproteobacteria bacterium AqS3]